MREMAKRTVIVGSGCAGFNAADWLAAQGETDVLLVTEKLTYGTSRNTGSDKQTYYKLSLAGAEADSVEAMAQTLKRDDVDGDLALCEAAGSAQCFLKLALLGVPFPTNEMGEFIGYQTDHDQRRRASSVGPLTSKVMTEALERSVLSRNVEILENVLAFRVLTDDNGVCGLECLDLRDNSVIRIRCAHVILATGGPAGIYFNRVYPKSQFGMSGMAFDAGATAANLDCWQYGLASIKFRWNVSGSYQQAIPRYVSVDEEGVEREFLSAQMPIPDALERVFLKGYQWPYDPRKVSGSSMVDILVKAEEDLGRKVYMDYRRNPSGYDSSMLTKEALTYLQQCGALCETPIERLRAINAPAIELYKAHGIDLAHEMLQISVCAQHHNGGIQVDAHWQSDIPGLYACGEAAGTFGQYRPGGTALNSTQVGSMRAAQHIHRHGRSMPNALPPYAAPLVLQDHPRARMERMQRLMSRHASFQRDVVGMKAMKQEIEALKRHLEPLREGDALAVDQLRLRDMLRTQEAVLSAMLFAESDQSAGVLETKGLVSTRRLARPLPDRDMWFERVWRKDREERGLCDGEV